MKYFATLLVYLVVIHNLLWCQINLIYRFKATLTGKPMQWKQSGNKDIGKPKTLLGFRGLF